MSRIHDALKKAVAEKISRGSASSSTDFLDVEGELRRPIEVGDTPQAGVLRGVSHNGSLSSLRYEELIKRCSHPIWNPDSPMNIFKDQGTKNGGSESFRTLRSRLHQIASTRTLKRILITSSVPEEGKTFVAANLALSIVRQPDRRVLLIDGDLRASRLHVPLGAPKTPGLTEYLRGEADEYSVIQSGMDSKLCLIPGGNEVANPSELLLSDQMKRLLEIVTPLFDFIILDSPPAIPVHDPSFLADLCDGTLFVIRAGATGFETIERAIEEFSNKNLLGVVLNGIEPGAFYGKYYTSYYGNSEN
jgi:protein-tyrosine kinase